ncbi:serine/threonine-protein kinase [Streptomyces sp. GC420]|uniref:serine/threonine-protein kinase n=1 Tax=Streptomyces sp. GC420 TaxID=2697568 RepID=UPI001AA12288|nr:serine/threonine-protein kinase [Streptomyces sp. GC420]
MGEVFAGRYELVDPIGRGGAGAVWRAWDHRRRRYVAAKVLQQSDAHALLRFVREQALRIDHPHVLAPASWAADDDKVLFTMDLVRGGSLAHLIGDYGPLPPAYVCVLTDQLLSGLAAVHAEGVVHRDIKPANILLEATGTGRPHIRLSDFGIAMRKGEPRLTEANYVVGTPGYFAPEQMMGAEPDFPADLFAVGLVAVYLLQGAKPDTKALVGHFAEHGTPGAPQGIPEPLWQVLATLLQPDPEARFRTATGARKALTAAAELLPEPGPDDELVEVFDQLGPLPMGFTANGPVKPPRPSVPPAVGPPAADPSAPGLTHVTGTPAHPPRRAPGTPGTPGPSADGVTGGVTGGSFATPVSTGQSAGEPASATSWHGTGQGSAAVGFPDGTGAAPGPSAQRPGLSAPDSTDARALGGDRAAPGGKGQFPGSAPAGPAQGFSPAADLGGRGAVPQPGGPESRTGAKGPAGPQILGTSPDLPGAAVAGRHWGPSPGSLVAPQDGGAQDGGAQDGSSAQDGTPQDGTAWTPAADATPAGGAGQWTGIGPWTPSPAPGSPPDMGRDGPQAPGPRHAAPPASPAAAKPSMSDTGSFHLPPPPLPAGDRPAPGPQSLVTPHGAGAHFSPDAPQSPFQYPGQRAEQHAEQSVPPAHAAPSPRTPGFPVPPPDVSAATAGVSREGPPTRPYTAGSPPVPLHALPVPYTAQVPVPRRRPGPPPRVAVPVLLLAALCFAVGIWALAQLL